MFRRTKVLVSKQVKFSEGDNWRQPDWDNRHPKIARKQRRAKKWAAKYL